MVFAFTFGAFGDIVSAADLALRVSKALSSSRGSTYDYQYLIQELDALAHVLQVAEAATRTGLLERTTVNSLNAEVLRCRNVVERLWDQVRKYQKALGSGSKENGIEASWRKIGWGLFKTEDVREARAKLTTHRLTLIALMTACNQSRLDKLLAQNTQLESSMEVVTTQVKELTIVMRQLPTKLGYARPNAITIQDPFGTNTLLPMVLCENPQQFDDMLALVSSKWPALMRQTIKTGNYVPICVEAGARLDHADEKEWMSSVVPGRTIRISYLVDWHPTSMTGQAMGKLLQFLVCPDCERGGGPR
ncbi:hypothetical protein LXA43DRAFT_5916 [Ganoderma leucocontextum]|nr:hypothetical protein LXA43DRAFT_5916 [Ganoderma leucocontextum]